MANTLIDHTGKSHKITFDVRVSGENCPDYFYRRVICLIDGIPTLAWECWRDDVSDEYRALNRAAESFLAGDNHPSHYTGPFAYLAK